MKFKHIFIFFVLVGSGFVTGGFLSYRSTLDLLEVAIVTDGEVTEVREVRRSGGSVYKPVVRYIDHRGTERDYVANFSTNPPAYFVGEKVRLLYDPNNPKYPLNVRIYDGFGLWFKTAGLSGFGIFILLVAGATMFLYLKGGQYPVGKKPTSASDGYDF